MTDEKRKVDRRIQRTHQLLREALIALIVEKGGYNDIAIQEITDRANVARTTFYLHFRDKDELLFETLRQVYDEIASVIEGVDVHNLLKAGPDQVYAQDYEHVAERAEFYRIMLGEQGSPAFIARVRSYLASVNAEQVIKPLMDDTDQAQMPPELIGYALAGMQIGILHWWLENDLPITPQTIAYYAQQLAVRGLPWALDLPEAPADDA
jgi:AcrR family transcriptional regulator